jgi:threonine/homoserine/homoserine lactone efflux protein
MDFTAILPYFVAVVALTAAPGPLMAVLVVRSLQQDSKGAAAFAAGLCAGDVLAVCAVALGIGVWAQTMPGFLSLAKYLGVAYLLWLAVGMWNSRAGADLADGKKNSWIASAGAGMALCLGNPSTLLIYLLLLPVIAPDGISNAEQMLLVASVTFAAVGVVFFGTILLAKQLGKVIAKPDSSNLFSRITAAVIALTSVWILAA